LGIAHLLGGDFAASVKYYDRAIPLLREMGDLPRLASSLTGRGHASGVTVSWETSISPTDSDHALRDFREAIQIYKEIGSPAGEAWLTWSLGRLYIVQGLYGQALEVIQRGLNIATQIGHREWIVGNRCNLGFLYLELLAPEKARRQLGSALVLAEELQSRYWIHNATSYLAAAYCLLDDLTQAQTCLESVLSVDTPMDTLAQRFCWARRAELALYQDNPALAFDIVKRLIDSAPGMSPGRVISFLWKLKGEALGAIGEVEQAISLLQAAIENAEATGERFLLWRLHASLGRLYRPLEHQEEAEKEFSAAGALIEELAATIPDKALKENFHWRAHQKIDKMGKQPKFENQ
jgi:tetratricopeptide (TPR) repeat protein